MKKYFYTLFITLSVISAFGFRSCDYIVCVLIAELNFIVSQQGPLKEISVTKGGEVWKCENWFCDCEVESLADKSLNKIAGDSSSLESAASLLTIVGDSGIVFFSTDYGKSWEYQGIPGLTKNLYGLDFFMVSQGTGVVVCGDSGTIYKSSDTGITWEEVSTITQNKLTSIVAYGSENFIAVGENGTIIKGSDTAGWEDKSVDPGINFNKILLGDDVFALNRAWAVGSGGSIYATTDYGGTWIQQNSGVTTDLYDIIFRTATEGVVVGAQGVVRYTLNGGVTWLEDTYFNGLTDGDIIAITGVDPNTATALVRNTTIDGGTTTSIFTVSSEPLAIDETENTIPSEYSLGQNYPNPFNPTTKIKYSIPSVTLSGVEGSLVTLKVYDILGNEVSTLVNEEKPAGVYEVEFDAKGLSSGMYFYRIQAGSPSTGSGQGFVETKKMILLK